MTESSKSKLGIIDEIKFASEAIDFTIEETNKSRRFNDRYPLWGIEKISFIVSKLRPKELKKLVNIFSSYNHGKYILDSVFPRNENPDDFHSNEFAVCSVDNPVQVLGWDDYESMITQGVEEGLSEDWITFGFEERAIERGINLEWYFFENPSQVDSQSKTGSFKALME